ncbi:MAG: 4-alpha-glucanotransferase [Gemmatimonadaceae bacterium]
MRSALHTLAARCGIVPDYVDQSGKERRVTSDEARIALLEVMGMDASTEQRAREALAALDEEERRELLPPVRVIEAGRASAATSLVLPRHVAGAGEWELTLEEEEGIVHRKTGELARRHRATTRPSGFAIPLPADTPPGYHTLRLAIDTPVGAHEAEQRVIVVPSSCPDIHTRLGGHRVYGITANLYSARSARNWGAGDIGDLRALIDWGAGKGAAFVGVNPLHALRNSGGDISPYSPVSRLFRNVLYLDPVDVPELAESEEARALMDTPAFHAELAHLRASTRVEYERVVALKRPVLEALHRTFCRLPRESRRSLQYAHYVASQGSPLDDFATFVALTEQFGRQDGTIRGWRAWPAPYRDPRSAAVDRYRRAKAPVIDFHRWLQFELDSQLASAARLARERGMRVGVYQDLAIGTSPDGSDSWAFHDLFLHGASVGAPPDDYSREGQNWGLPPLDPRVLRRTRYEFWIRLVRSAMRHAGALRIDHVMGLFQLFVIPQGMRGRQGAYLRYPAHDLLGILALEATRAGALVVGEDLGTVPADVPSALDKWGVLSSKVLYFERDAKGSFKAAAHYAARSLATANTHDMATVAGFWQGRDIDVKRETGIIDDSDAAAARRARQKERSALIARLRAEKVLPAGATVENVDAATLRGAVHEMLARSPAALVGFSLDDLVGEVEPVNVPGAGPDRFSSWTRRLTTSIEDLATDPAVAASLRTGGRG